MNMLVLNARGCSTGEQNKLFGNVPKVVGLNTADVRRPFRLYLPNWRAGRGSVWFSLAHEKHRAALFRPQVNANGCQDACLFEV